MKKKDHDHLVLQGQHMHCRHCGAMEQVKVPALLKDWIKQGDNFIGRHKDCKQRAYEGSDQ